MGGKCLPLNAIPNKNASTYPTSANSSISAEQTKTVGQKMTYANAVSSYPSTKNQEYMDAIPKMNKIPTSTLQKFYLFLNNETEGKGKGPGTG